MVIPKYDINQCVFIYSKGKLVERVINKIKIIITDNQFEVSYQFSSSEDSISLLFDVFKLENEVFNSLDHFMKINNSDV